MTTMRNALSWFWRSKPEPLFEITLLVCVLAVAMAMALEGQPS